MSANRKTALAFMLFLLILGSMQFIVPYIIDFDGYPIKAAEIIKKEGFLRNFPVYEDEWCAVLEVKTKLS